MSNVNYKLEDGKLIIALHDRVDTNNVPEVEKEIEDIKAENQGNYNNLVLDVEDLIYISSAGLRVILRLRKTDATLKIINASTEVYEIFEMTGFTEMIDVSKAFKKMSVEGCTVIGKGAKGTVYRYDPETIIKVYNNKDSLPGIKRERELARKAFVLGVPTAISYDIVLVDDKYGSVFELLDAMSFTEVIKDDPEKKDFVVKATADLLRTIHTTMVSKDDMPDVKDTIYNWLETDKPYLKESTYAKLKQMIDDVPDTLNMIHGDFHTNNIMNQNDEAILIDMDTLSHGHPIFELANIYIAYVGFGIEDPAMVENFIGLDYETAKKIWAEFLPLYLQTDDKEKVEDVNNKAALLAYIRYMRHYVRRNKDDEERLRKSVDASNERIEALIDKVNELTF